MAAKLKSKTHKGLSKRVKITGTGKLVRGKGGKSHLLSGKSAKRRRNLRKTTTIPDHLAKGLREKLAG